MAFPYRGPDISYAQGAYALQGWENFGIINASRANVGFAVGSYYHYQVDRFRQAGREVGHYFFNGNIGATQCADFFVDNLYDFRQGDSLWLDVEAEGGTGTAAWNPSQALEFCNRVKARTGVMPGIYLNKSLENGSDWSACVRAGARLWSAYYQGGALPAVRNWPEVSMLQYTSSPIDTNMAQYTQAQMAGIGGSSASGRKKKMYLAWTTDGTGWLVTEDDWYPMAGPQIYNLFYRLIVSDQNKSPFVNGGAPDTFNLLEKDMMRSNLRLLKAQNQTGVPIDVDKLAKALSTELGTGFQVNATVSDEALAAAFTAATPKIVAALVQQASADLTSEVSAAVQSALVGAEIQIDTADLTKSILDAMSQRLSA
jgi:hypothetical protein